jgi:transmembrane 9 superfamily protein 3
LVILSAVVGTGAQLALLVLLVILLAIVGMLYVGYVACSKIFAFLFWVIVFLL